MAFKADLINLNLDEVKKYSVTNNDFTSIFLYALSTATPGIETTAVRIAQLAKKQILDKQLKNEIDLFINQETNHTKIHNIWNKHIFSTCKSNEFLLNRENYINSIRKKYFSKNKDKLNEMVYHMDILESLGGTLFIWVFSSHLQELSNEEKTMWGWHGIEEIEHSHVSNNIPKLFEKVPIYKKIYRRIICLFLPILELLYRTFKIASNDNLFRKKSFYFDTIKFFFIYKNFPKLMISLIAKLCFNRNYYSKKRLTDWSKDKDKFLIKTTSSFT